MLQNVICSACKVTHQRQRKYIAQATSQGKVWTCMPCSRKLRRVDIAGQKFNRLLVLESIGVDSHNKSVVRCLCDCGNEHITGAQSVKSGNTKSCGCLNSISKELRKTHGQSKTRTYRIWMAMKARCKYEYSPMYHRYGGRGISVCERWASYENFLEDMGEAPDDYQIDRVDNDGNYCPENCRWSSRLEQSRNKSNNRVIEFNGESKCLKEWADSLGIDQASLAERIEKWPLDLALTKPKGR